jgi:hypothetical protein
VVRKRLNTVVVVAIIVDIKYGQTTISIEETDGCNVHAGYVELQKVVSGDVGVDKENRSGVGALVYKMISRV